MKKKGNEISLNWVIVIALSLLVFVLIFIFLAGFEKCKQKNELWRCGFSEQEPSNQKPVFQYVKIDCGDAELKIDEHMVWCEK